MATSTLTVRARGPLPSHGERARYQRGCRCGRCSRANTGYMRDYRTRNAVAVLHRVIERSAGGMRWSEPPLPGVG